MRIRRLKIANFRGIAAGSIDFEGDTLLVGGNNIGKSTICEALDLLLGPERLFRKPIIDEHDFHLGRYEDDEMKPIQVTLEAVLVDLSPEAEKRFKDHLRPWDDKEAKFSDEVAGSVDNIDTSGAIWALPIVFFGRYDSAEDDFVGNTFFDHPTEDGELDAETQAELGQGRKFFTRAHKRLCGFVYLRALRTGSRALSLERGSLLDSVLKLGDGGSAPMWKDTLARLSALKPSIGDVDQLKSIRSEIRTRMGRFVGLAAGDESTGFFASDLTREHLREVVKLFVASQPSEHLVPFERLGTGSINLLVFALLTFIAELKSKHSVIFAMEEPEIALPPHTQRRVTKFILDEMGQAIVTSHSPYVIEQFAPEQIVILARDASKVLVGRPIRFQQAKPKTYRTERRQFAEALMSNAVLVVEGHSEAAVFPIASSILEKSVDGYVHIDLAGVSIFNAGGDGGVPIYGPTLADLNKLAFAFYDKPNKPLKPEQLTKLSMYKQSWESPEKGLENLLVREVSSAVITRFLEAVHDREDYPANEGEFDSSASEVDMAALAVRVLKVRKGDGYAAIFVEQCQSVDQLPKTIVDILLVINDALKPPMQSASVGGGVSPV